MTNFIGLMEIDAKRATPADFAKAKKVLTDLQPKLKTPQDYQKAYSLLEAKVMQTKQGDSAVSALVALKIAKEGNLPGWTSVKG